MSGERRRSGPESRNAAGLESTGTDFETRCTSTCTSIEFIIIAYLGHLGGEATGVFGELPRFGNGSTEGLYFVRDTTPRCTMKAEKQLPFVYAL